MGTHLVDPFVYLIIKITLLLDDTCGQISNVPVHTITYYFFIKGRADKKVCLHSQPLLQHGKQILMTNLFSLCTLQRLHSPSLKD